MSETNVIALPGLLPEATRHETNEDAIKQLEETLEDFKAGRLRALLLVAHAPDMNVLRYSTPTYSDKIQVMGLAQALQTHLAGDIAAAAFE